MSDMRSKVLTGHGGLYVSHEKVKEDQMLGNGEVSVGRG